MMQPEENYGLHRVAQIGWINGRTSSHDMKAMTHLHKLILGSVAFTAQGMQAQAPVCGAESGNGEVRPAQATTERSKTKHLN